MMTWCRTYRVKRVALLLLLLCLGPFQSITAQSARQVEDPFAGIDVDERFGESIPTDLTFTDEAGRVVRLADYFDGEHPVILNFMYNDCPMLCSIILDAMTAGLRDLAWAPGNEFEVLSVSFSPSETPAQARAQKARYLEMLGRPEAADGWHFLVGEQDAITTLADAVGFRYKWDPDLQQYAHPAVLVFLSGDATVSRYLYGVQFPAAQLRNALVDTGDGQVGSMMEKLILSCYLYDPEAHSYTLSVMRVMRLAGSLFVLLMGSILFVFWRREVRRQVKTSSEPV